MDEGDEHEEYHKKLIAEMQTRIKEQTDGIMGSMLEQMAPMLMGTQLLQDEAKAWDGFVHDFVSAPKDKQIPSEQMMGLATSYADAMLAERRRRFNESASAERMRGMLPSGRGLCNKPVVVNDKDTGMRCTRNADHDPTGGCY